MPPSGYSDSQAASLSNFLSSCAQALAQEGKEDDIAPTSALRRECEKINESINEQENERVEEVLALTKSFYISVLKNKPKTYTEYEKTVKKEITKFQKDISNFEVKGEFKSRV